MVRLSPLFLLDLSVNWLTGLLLIEFCLAFFLSECFRLGVSLADEKSFLENYCEWVRTCFLGPTAFFRIWAIWDSDSFEALGFGGEWVNITSPMLFVMRLCFEPFGSIDMSMILL